MGEGKHAHHVLDGLRVEFTGETFLHEGGGVHGDMDSVPAFQHGNGFPEGLVVEDQHAFPPGGRILLFLHVGERLAGHAAPHRHLLRGLYVHGDALGGALQFDAAFDQENLEIS